MAIDLAAAPDLRDLDRMIARIVKPNTPPPPSPGPHVPLTPAPVSVHRGTRVSDLAPVTGSIREITAQGTDRGVVGVEVRAMEVVVTGREVGSSWAMVTIHLYAERSRATLMPVNVVPGPSPALTVGPSRRGLDRRPGSGVRACGGSR